MRAGLVTLLLCCALSASAAVTDQALRYVNGEVVTMSDVRLRVAMRTQDYVHQGKVLPQSRDETIAFMQQALEQITDEILMVQKAKELKLVPDHDTVVLDVLKRAQELGQGMNLADQARARKERERQQSIEYLLNYFYDVRTPEATPAQLVAEYQKRQSEFHRPARARVITILLRPSDPSLAKDLRRAELDLFKRTQDAPDADVAKAATSRVDAFTAVDATTADQDKLLGELLVDLVAQAPRQELDDKSRALVQTAIDLQAQAASIRDIGQTVALLTAERAQLVGKDEEAFRATARRISQGPNASEGGEQGWVEPGTFPAEVDQRVFATAAGAMTEVFVANQAAWLVYVQQREDPRVRSFDEVAGELEASLRRARREALRAKVTGILRAKATISEVAPVSSLLD